MKHINTFYLHAIAYCLGAFLIGQLAIRLIDERQSPKRVMLRQPYILYVDNITPEMRVVCSGDENCMDVLLWSDLPLREDK